MTGYIKRVFHYQMRIVLWVSILVVTVDASAMDLFPENCERGDFGGSFDVSFDSGDAFIGVALYINSKKKILDEAFVFSALWRPIPDKVIEKVSEKTYYIYRHEFFSFQAGVEEQIHLTRHIKLFFTPMVGIFHINRRGSTADKTGVIAPLIHTGIGYRFGMPAEGNEGIQIRVGYQMIRSDAYDSDKFLISFLISA